MPIRTHDDTGSSTYGNKPHAEDGLVSTELNQRSPQVAREAAITLYSSSVILSVIGGLVEEATPCQGLSRKGCEYRIV